MYISAGIDAEFGSFLSTLGHTLQQMLAASMQRPANQSSLKTQAVHGCVLLHVAKLGFPHSRLYAFSSNLDSDCLPSFLDTLDFPPSDLTAVVFHVTPLMNIHTARLWRELSANQSEAVASPAPTHARGISSLPPSYQNSSVPV